MRFAGVLLFFSRLRPEVQASCLFALAGLMSAALVLASSGASHAFRTHR